MKHSTFSEEQIIAILKEQEAGMATADVRRRHGISSATFHKWEVKFGRREVRLRQLGGPLNQSRQPLLRGLLGLNSRTNLKLSSDRSKRYKSIYLPAARQVFLDHFSKPSPHSFLLRA